MTINNSFNALESLRAEVIELLDQLPTLQHSKWIGQALATLVRIASTEVERLDWKILSAALQDMEQGFQIFYPYRHVRKVAIFGSARISPDTPEYRMAVDFARSVAQQGYMVMTGAGGGIMQAGNEGAGAEKSFGLNIKLPFEQEANPFIEGDPKLFHFKYFFTRKLFLLKESDAIAL
ncbi:MAG TPA: cytochrome D ubiquinol oxidase subunit II, partial [Cyanobacteria bacterium UBA11372]|nr:cytochrome D ubiquinol oxidase subunit II [Cyanobacteria bacterium UBA11372]